MRKAPKKTEQNYRFLSDIDLLNMFGTNKALPIISIDKDFDRVKFNELLAINLSCKMSVKANTFIGSLEQETLLKRLFECEFPYTCPHGRPTIIKYTKYELEKLFKRVNG